MIGQQALQQISFDWRSRLPGWTIEFLGPRTGLRGLTFPAQRRIEVYIRPGSSVSDAHVIAHELGHALDVTRLTNAERVQWRNVRGISDSTPWFPQEGVSDFASGAGDFAEAFAVSQLGTGSNSHLGGGPTSAQRNALYQMIG